MSTTSETGKYNTSISNLNQLKKALQEGANFDILYHNVPGFVTPRIVSVRQSKSIYSQVRNEPDHEISKANGGRGAFFEFKSAKNWEFENGVASFYGSEIKGEHTQECLLLSMAVLAE